MKKALLAALLLVGLGSANIVQAAAYDWVWTLNDAFDSPYTFNLAGEQGDENPRILSLDGASNEPVFLGIGGVLEVDNGALSLGQLPLSQTDGLIAALAGKASTSHTHSTGDITGLASFVDNRIGTSTYGTTTRSLNTAFKVSSTSPTFVSYSVDIGSTLTLVTGQTGTVVLEYADDSGFTTNVKTVQSSANGNTGTLAIGLNLTQTTTAALTGIVPANKWIRIRTVNTVGTPTFTYRGEQEVQFPH